MDKFIDFICGRAWMSFFLRLSLRTEVRGQLCRVILPPRQMSEHVFCCPFVHCWFQQPVVADSLDESREIVVSRCNRSQQLALLHVCTIVRSTNRKAPASGLRHQQFPVPPESHATRPRPSLHARIVWRRRVMDVVTTVTAPIILWP